MKVLVLNLQLLKLIQTQSKLFIFLFKALFLSVDFFEFGFHITLSSFDFFLFLLFDFRKACGQILDLIMDASNCRLVKLNIDGFSFTLSLFKFLLKKHRIGLINLNHQGIRPKNGFNNAFILFQGHLFFIFLKAALTVSKAEPCFLLFRFRCLFFSLERCRRLLLVSGQYFWFCQMALLPIRAKTFGILRWILLFLAAHSAVGISL